jgi:hypothetical protein
VSAAERFEMVRLATKDSFVEVLTGARSQHVLMGASVVRGWCVGGAWVVRGWCVAVHGVVRRSASRHRRGWRRSMITRGGGTPGGR